MKLLTFLFWILLLTRLSHAGITPIFPLSEENKIPKLEELLAKIKKILPENPSSGNYKISDANTKELNSLLETYAEYLTVASTITTEGEGRRRVSSQHRHYQNAIKDTFRKHAYLFSKLKSSLSKVIPGRVLVRACNEGNSYLKAVQEGINRCSKRNRLEKCETIHEQSKKKYQLVTSRLRDYQKALSYHLNEIKFKECDLVQLEDDIKDAYAELGIVTEPSTGINATNTSNSLEKEKIEFYQLTPADNSTDSLMAVLEFNGSCPSGRLESLFENFLTGAAKDITGKAHQLSPQKSSFSESKKILKDKIKEDRISGQIDVALDYQVGNYSSNGCSINANFVKYDSPSRGQNISRSTASSGYGSR